MPEPFKNSQHWETSWSMSSWGGVTADFQVTLIDTKISQGESNLNYSKCSRCNFDSWQSLAESDTPGAPRPQKASLLLFPKSLETSESGKTKKNHYLPQNGRKPGEGGYGCPRAPCSTEGSVKEF